MSVHFESYCGEIETMDVAGLLRCVTLCSLVCTVVSRPALYNNWTTNFQFGQYADVYSLYRK